MTKDFTHLHVHTEFSILDGASKIDELVKKASDEGMSALGITDHGNMFGVPSFYKSCKKFGVKPIIGVELYQAKETVDERPSRKGKSTDDSGGSTESGDKIYYHVTAIAESQEGYVNLMKLSSEAYLKPPKPIAAAIKAAMPTATPNSRFFSLRCVSRQGSRFIFVDISSYLA